MPMLDGSCKQVSIDILSAALCNLLQENFIYLLDPLNRPIPHSEGPDEHLCTAFESCLCYGSCLQYHPHSHHALYFSIYVGMQLHPGISGKSGLSHQKLGISLCLMAPLLQHHVAAVLLAGFSSEQC